MRQSPVWSNTCLHITAPVKNTERLFHSQLIAVCFESSEALAEQASCLQLTSLQCTQLVKSCNLDVGRGSLLHGQALCQHIEATQTDCMRGLWEK
eukprot:1350327-Amphidinium_carterae.2